MLGVYLQHSSGSAPLLRFFLDHAPKPGKNSIIAMLNNRGKTWDYMQTFQMFAFLSSPLFHFTTLID